MTELLLNDFAERSFRNVADQDYIAARMSYRSNLREPFLWSSLQAIEKYLKAILLFNRKDSRKVKHDLDKALRKVESIVEIKFSIPTDVRDFIRYLNEYGGNRYLEGSSHLQGDGLMLLDKSVWHIRKFCYYMNSKINVKGEAINLLSHNIVKSTEAFEDKEHKFSIQGGLLERCIKKNDEAAKNLIWHNFFYGRNKKNTIKNDKRFTSSVNPTLVMHPEIFEELNKLVTISWKTREYFREMSSNKDTGNAND